MDTTQGAAPLQPTMEELARRAVAAAQKCECGAVATYAYCLAVAGCPDAGKLCRKCCRERSGYEPESLLGNCVDGSTVEEIPEGIHAVEVARAYGIEGAE